MKLYFITSEETFEIPLHSDLSLKETCLLYSIPYESVSFYYNDKEQFKVLTGLYTKVSELEKAGYEIIYIRPDRNISYKRILKKPIKLNKVEHAVAEYTFSDADSPDVLKHIAMTEADCHMFVAERVKKFLTEEVELNSAQKLVVGVSGGGDSNTLIESLLASGLVKKEQLVAAMMLGIPDWDAGKERAINICNTHGVTLNFIQAGEVQQLLGYTSKDEWITRFEKEFPGTDFEVIGTLGVRLSLSHMARKIDAQAVILGFNTEDILAESFLQLMKGQLPLPYPVREIDNVKIWYPLYECPKKILDGCHPEFSLQNYSDRFPSKMPGRAIPYYMAQMMHSILPGVEFDLLLGFKALSQRNVDFANLDQDLQFSTLGFLKLSDRLKWKKYLGK